MKKFLLLSLIVAFFATSSNAQSIFAPKPTPYPGGAFRLSSTDSTHNFFRPTISVSATFSNGASMAGGFGIQFQHDRADAASNTWVPIYTVSAIGFITTNGNRIGGTAGIVVGIPGTAGVVNVGAGRDFTNGVYVLITGANISL
jgi:hypothetical protein